MSEPTPRSTSDSLKFGPCGGVAAVPGVFTKVARGADVVVKFEETVGHEGCYQVAWSSGGGPFQVVTQVPDPADSQGMQTITVKAPNQSCPDCVLQLRQIMLGGPCTDAGTQMPGATDTYYHCADVCVGNTCPSVPDAGADAGASSSSSGGSVSSSGEPITSRPDAGDARVFDDTGGVNSGCHVGGAAGGIAGLLGLLFARRRRAAKTAT
jgi:hypothetical protein